MTFKEHGQMWALTPFQLQKLLELCCHILHIGSGSMQYLQQGGSSYSAHSGTSWLAVRVLQLSVPTALTLTCCGCLCWLCFCGTNWHVQFFRRSSFHVFAVHKPCLQMSDSVSHVIALCLQFGGCVGPLVVVLCWHNGVDWHTPRF